MRCEHLTYWSISTVWLVPAPTESKFPSPPIAETSRYCYWLHILHIRFLQWFEHLWN